MTTSPARPQPEDDEDAHTSGEHVLLHRDVGEDRLAPPPSVLVKRPRIVTGQYAIVTPRPRRP